MSDPFLERAYKDLEGGILREELSLLANLVIAEYVKSQGRLPTARRTKSMLRGLAGTHRAQGAAIDAALVKLQADGGDVEDQPEVDPAAGEPR